MRYKMYISVSTPTRHRAFCHHARPRRDSVSVVASACVVRSASPCRCDCSRCCNSPAICTCASRVSVCRARAESRRESVRCRRRVVSRSRGGLPVSESTGRLVSYSRVRVSTSSAIVRSRVRYKAICRRRISSNSLQ